MSAIDMTSARPLRVVPDPAPTIDTTSDSLLTTAMFADMLHVTTNRLLQLRHEDRLPPAIKIGKSLRWLRSDVDTWLLDHRET